jgi:hypothetical protein
MPAFNEQTVLHCDILTPPFRQRDEAFLSNDERRIELAFSSPTPG